MKYKAKPIMGIYILIITVIGQLALALKYFLLKDMVGCFVALGIALIWAIAASMIHKAMTKKRIVDEKESGSN